MDVTRLLIALFVGMAVLIFLIMKTRLHPSLSLVISACVVGIVGGVELASIPGLITSGFGNTLAGIGLVIAFGCMMGQIMEESNSAKVMAHTFIKALHGKNEEIALAITGFLDTIDLGTYILFAIAMGIPLMVLIGIMSRIVGRKWYKVVDENGEIVDVAPENIEEYARISSQATVPELDPNESYPSVVMSFAPIFVPVILILASTFTSMMYKGDATPVTEIIGFLGSRVIAISISLLVSIYGLAGNKSRQEVLDCLERGVKSCGTVILITGAGGAFGNIIKSSGIGDVIANGLASANMPILLLPFLMAAILKLVLGSGTVAMTTTATICAPILMQIPGANMMYCAYAACIGSQVFSLHNDSFFWVLTRTFKFDKLDVQILGYEGMQFIWSWVGFGLLCIVNAVF